ncbi:hypothetical protein M1M92_04940 [Peptococcaceae bacterium]|nr:hypothetical protein [Peptococcaceae bacterium]
MKIILKVNNFKSKDKALSVELVEESLVFAQKPVFNQEKLLEIWRREKLTEEIVMLRYKGWLEDKPRAMYDQDMFEITGQSKKYFQW